MTAVVSAVAAVDKLDADDPYGKLVGQWLAVIDDLADGDRPPKPPKLDTRRLSEALCSSRKAARDAALKLWDKLHDEWAAGSVERKAMYDAQRDWTDERAARATHAEERKRQARTHLARATGRDGRGSCRAAPGPSRRASPGSAFCGKHRSPHP